MKKYLTLLVLLALLSVAAQPERVAAAQADHYPAVLKYVDAQLEVFVPYLIEYQDGYYLDNGFYFQALQSHHTPPDGVQPPDDPNSHPTDQAEALAALWSYSQLPASINWSLRVDTYNGPDGSGYVLTVETSIGIHVWSRSINYGPVSEDWRNHDWVEE